MKSTTNEIINLAYELNDYINETLDYTSFDFYDIRDFIIFKLYLLSIKKNSVIEKELADTFPILFSNVSKNALPVGLWSGLTGICSLFQEAYVCNLIKKGNFQILEDGIITIIRKNVFNQELNNHRFYDLFYGLCGIGTYFLENYNSTYLKFINEIINCIYTFFSKDNFSFKIFSVENEEYSSNKHIVDLSASHGIIQILQFLNICSLNNINNPYIKILSDKIINHYEQTILFFDNSFCMIQKYNLDDTHLINDFPYSWNYGSFAPVALLYLITKKYSFNYYILDNIKKNPIEYNKYNLAFTGGLSGISLFMYLLFMEDNSNTIYENIWCETLSHILNRKEEIFDLVDKKNISLSNGALSILISMLEQTKCVKFHIYVKWLLVNRFIPKN